METCRPAMRFFVAGPLQLKLQIDSINSIETSYRTEDIAEKLLKLILNSAVIVFLVGRIRTDNDRQCGHVCHHHWHQAVFLAMATSTLGTISFPYKKGRHENYSAIYRNFL